MELLLGLPQEWQIVIILATILSGFIITMGFFRTLRILIRGYPPEPVYKLEECSNEGTNLTGHCLKVGGCRTQAECDHICGYKGD